MSIGTEEQSSSVTAGKLPTGPGAPTTYTDPTTGDTYYQVPDPSDPLGLRGGKQWKLAYTGYEKNKSEREAEKAGGQGRNDALTAAMDALSGYLQASSLADARRQAAFDQFSKISQFALPPGATTAPGYEVGGPANAFAASIGEKQYTPPPIQTQQVNPAALQQEAPLSPAVQQMLAGVLGAGGAGAGV